MGSNQSHHDTHHHKEHSKYKREYTVPDFDQNRFSGDWWELAKIPYGWQECCDRTLTSYQFNTIDNTFNATNRFFKSKILVREKNFLLKPDECPGKYCGKTIECQSSTACPVESKEFPFWIHWTDYENYAIIGSPNGDYLWVLSRRETVAACEISYLLMLVKCFGYDCGKLVANSCSVEPCKCKCKENEESVENMS